MSTFVSTSSVKTHEALLQRYRELYFDFKTEFRRSMVRSMKICMDLALPFGYEATLTIKG